jgi:tryptophan halogenase
LVKLILIVGGGSAGWITANLLNAKLNNNSPGTVAITVVESPNIPKIGVGEATIPSLRGSLQAMGINERDFMRATDATFKNLIRFDNWNAGASFDHPFDRRERPSSDATIAAWLTQNPQDIHKNEFAKTYSLLSHISEAGLAPRLAQWPEYGSPFPYAYHLDAIKLAAYLARHGAARGIGHQLANITDVKIDEAGNISSICDDKNGEHRADLYIDCTGFRAVLSRQALKVESRDFGQYLLCDSAVTLRVPYDIYKPEQLNPFTTASAMTAGWRWDIGLKNRRGLGYVYASEFENSQGAEQALRAQEGSHTNGLEAQHIKFKTTQSESPWTGNCVAIGLSAGFLEPLESSGLYLIEFAANMLGDLLPYASESFKPLARSFNEQMDLIFTEILEYINLHYCLSNRDDSEFWREVRKPERILPTLRDKLELWKIKPPSDTDFAYPLRLFSLQSYEYLLFGMNHKPNNALNTDASLPDFRDAIAQSLGKLPRHEDVLSQL